jgi:large conductance mechanosensitive channel
MWQEFKTFALRGSVIDLAVGVIIGAAFNKIVGSLVNDIVMPPIGLLVARIDFSNLFLSLSGAHYDSLKAAKEAGAATINYGVFVNELLNFAIVAFVIFLVVRYINRLSRQMSAAAPAEAAPATKTCPYCVSTIAAQATRCPHCTSVLEG